MLNDPDAVVAGRYSVDIWLNGRYVGRDDVLFRQNTAGRTEPCLPAKFWDEQGVTAASEQAQDCFALKLGSAVDAGILTRAYCV